MNTQMNSSTYTDRKNNLCTYKNKTIGEIKGDVLQKKVKSSRHLLRVPPSWAIDLQVLRRAENAGVRHVRIYDTETGTIYQADLWKFMRQGFPVNRGYGEQVALPLDLFEVFRPGQPVTRQPTLFEGAL